VLALASGALFIIVDMGRPERLYQFWLNGNWQSPLMWDMMAITIYLTASVVYLYIPMIPDLALFRDKLGDRVHPLQAWMYRTLAIGWTGDEDQKRALNRSVGILMVAIIPIAASVHTVVSFIFATTSRVSWDSTIFGFFFVFGAIYSGIATLIIVIAIMRRIYHLEDYITLTHFRYLAFLMASMSLVMMYANATENLPGAFKMGEEERFAFEQLFAGTFAPMYWFYFFGGLVLPALIVAFRPTRNLTGFVVAAIFVNVAMFIERYFIVVAGLRVPIMDYEPASYSPTWVEWSVLASGFAGFMLLMTLFARFFPILAVWEMKEERIEDTEPEAAEPETAELETVS
jgi:Polysulphide reductase, NrfD